MFFIWFINYSYDYCELGKQRQLYRYDCDDPAIWINKDDVSESLIILTDKGEDEDDPNKYSLLKILNTSTIESDGNDVMSVSLSGFPEGMFVAMSNPKVFHFYSWEDITGEDL